MPEMGDQLARYKILMQMARCFGRPMNLQTLIDQILDRSKEVMRAEACSLFLPDLRTGELILHSTDPKITSLPAPLRLPAGKGLAGAAYQSRSTINVKDAKTDPRYFHGIARQVSIDARAMLTIPLLDGACCVGVLQALNPTGRECFDEEDEEIFEGFGGLIANALVRLEAEQQELELARSRQELLVAREIQDSFLPQVVQQFPFCLVEMNYHPASVVGGDFCSVHALDEHRLLLGVGDVTGKGMPAALSMARATAMIKALVPQLREDLGAWVSVLNRQLAEDLQAGRFIGMTFLLADAATKNLQICCAGQFAPLHFDGANWLMFSAANHLPLGIVADSVYRAESAELKPGDLWLLFSDGIPEGRSLAGDDFTLDRLCSVLDAPGSSARPLEWLVSKWKEFVNPDRQHDDASLLLLDWRGEEPPATLEISCCVEKLSQERQFIEQWAIYAGFDSVTRGQIVLACDEATTNVLRHAYQGQPGPLMLRSELTPTHLTISIADQAAPFNPTEFHGRDLSDLRPGGLGTVIIAKVFDEVNYQPNPTGTTLRLSKKLPRPSV
ncbi:MAG TPA: SpoIIE family protein phosphatase [Chthoniobacteraceae bacterium]|nr:SpoIIE family protein phosphatase [Chthoniobacteraceae bacterium]